MNVRSFSLRPHKRGKVPPWKLALLLIAAGVLGRLVLWEVPNVEPVMAVALIAGMLLGGYYVILVPVAVMVGTDVLTYALGWSGAYSPVQILGLGAFVYSGFVLAAAIGQAYRPRLLFRTRTIAVMARISIPATILFDLWTAFGDWLAISRHPPMNWSLGQVLEMQVPFTLVHLASSLIFVPIFGTLFLYLHTHGWPTPGPSPSGTDDSGPE